MKYKVSFSIQGDGAAEEIARLWPTLQHRQSRMAQQVPSYRRWTSFEGSVEDLALLVEQVGPMMTPEYSVFNFTIER